LYVNEKSSQYRIIVPYSFVLMNNSKIHIERDDTGKITKPFLKIKNDFVFFIKSKIVVSFELTMARQESHMGLS